MKQFYKLLALALEDGKITQSERELLLKKALQLGMDEIEAEMIIEGQVSKCRESTKTLLEETDGFLISNEELLLRTTKWVNRVSEKNIKVEMERFPRIKEDSKMYQKYLDESADIFKKINSGIVGNVAGMVPGVSNLIKSGLTLVGVNNLQKIDQKEIRAIADRYLLILELRSKKNQVLELKFKNLKETYKEQIHLHETNNKKGLRDLFK
jgi:hypothetical protein